jgi:3-hydroxy-9,10-secoandrosta-1,3,5(10)-triene-9,17-dione monooxygenase reductase component
MANPTTTNVSELFKQTAGKAIGRIPSGVFILTATNGDEVGAIMASWVQQCGFEPPAVSVALGKGRPIAELINASQRFALSVVGEDDTSLMKRYARGVKPGEDPFEGVETLTTPAGIPALKSALAWIECRLLKTCDYGGDHDVLIAQVTDGLALRPGPAFAHQRGSGFHY